MFNIWYFNLVVDVDECRENNGGCSHLCINTEGSFHCGCPSGLYLEDTNKTCDGSLQLLHYLFILSTYFHLFIFSI